jgi:trehalose synthase-fused probable maltokinase
MKLFRKVEPGLNPDVELGVFFTQQASFQNTPRLLGWLEFQPNGKQGHTAAMLQEFVPSRGQGWEFLLPLVVKFLNERADNRLDRTPHHLATLETQGALGTCLNEVALLARETARMHEALGGVVNDSAFAPEPFTMAHLRSAIEAVEIQRVRTWNAVAESSRDTEFKRNAHVLIDQIAVQSRDDPAGIDESELGLRTRIHGDFHLGQTLRTEHSYAILDFEGEPSKSIEERRRKQSPWRDVASMLRSLDYASAAALRLALPSQLALEEQLRAAATHFSHAAQTLFLNTYRVNRTGGANDAPFLLNLFLTEKALYELDYELNNRPDWAEIPLNGIRDLCAPELSPPRMRRV